MAELLIEEFKAVAAPIPAREHPWFQGVITGEFTIPELVLGEQQHYLRGRLNHKIFGAILKKATLEGDPEVLEIAQENYDEEVGGVKTHGDLMFQFLAAHGMSEEEAAAVQPTAGTMAAISMLTESIRGMTALEAIAMMSLPELQNGPISAEMHKALKEIYGFDDYTIETYGVHSEVDVGHGEMQLNLLAAKVGERPDLKPALLEAMRFGVNAFNYEWDGHYQALSDEPYFHWEGVEV